MNKGKQIKPHEAAKRNELIWALHQQGYTGESITMMFNLSTSRINVIINSMPRGWKSPWIKAK